MAEQQSRKSIRLQQQRIEGKTKLVCSCCKFFSSLDETKRKNKQSAPSDVTILDLTNDEDNEVSEPVEEMFDDQGIRYPSPEVKTNQNYGYDYNKFNNLVCRLKALGRNYRISTPDKTPLTAGMLYDTLREKEWFNGEVINSYFKSCELKFENVCVVDSYLYESYKSRGWKGLMNYSNLTNYSNYKTILFPFNVNGNHWTLFYADLVKKRLIYYDSLLSQTSTSSKQYVHTFIKAFFMLIYMSKIQHNMEPLNIDDWEFGYGICPQQSNNYDCGVFACCAATALLWGGEPAYSKEDMYLYRHTIVYNIFTQFHN